MRTDNTAIDKRLLGGLSGPEKLKILLKQHSGTLADWARNHAVDGIELHHCLAGRREYPEHRQRIADSLGLDRSEVNALIDGERPAKVA